MKRILIIAVLFSLVIAIAAPAMAAALYQGTIRITNTANATTNILVPFSINSTSFVANGYAEADFSDLSLEYSGSPVAFMPGYDGNPWMTYVESIGTSASIDYDLMAKGAIGGKVRYFPGPGGMTISDDSSLEGGNNFSINVTDVWLDDQLDVGKPGAVSINYHDGQIGGSLAGLNESLLQETSNTNSAMPIGHITAQRLDSVEAGFISSVSFSLYNYSGASGTVSVKIRSVSGDSILGTIGTINASAITNVPGTWYTFDDNSVAIPTTQDIRISLQNESDNSISFQLNTASAGAYLGYRSYYNSAWNDYSAQDMKIKVVYSNVVSTQAGEGEKDISLTLDTSDLILSVDGVPVDTTPLSGVLMPDNPNEWFVNAMYLYQFDIDVAGVNKCKIRWEYGDIFTDLSGTGNDAIPTFRTTSSDTDVTAELINFLPTSESQADDFTLSGSLPDIGVPENVSEMFSEGNHSYIPGAEAIDELLSEAGVPRTLWWYPFVYFSICIVGFIIYGATQGPAGPQSTSNGLDGSLLTMGIVIEALIVVAGIMNPVPLWPAYLFPIPALAITTSRKHFSWG